MHKSPYAQEMSLILARMDNSGNDEPTETKPLAEQTEPEEYDVYIEPDRITVIKRPEPPAQVIEAVQPLQPRPQPYVAYVAMLVSLFLLSYLVTAAFLTTFFPPTVTITILPKSQTLSLIGTLQLGRLLPPLTISQSQTVPTTGKGHQDARSANGYITFYNGLFTTQTIAAGTILTGADGTQVITDQEANIPAGNPPSYGHSSVSAHAITPGVKGNIPAFAINQACCASAVLAKNTTSFQGGADERNFPTVAKADIARTALPLKTAVAQSMQGALPGQLTPTEQLFVLPCTPIVTSDHQAGEEASRVKITVSDTCSAVAYNSQEAVTKATALLTHQAVAKLGTSYSLLGAVRVSVHQATITHTTTPPVFLSFQAQGTWVYALSPKAQERIKRSLAGKTKQEALQLLMSQPGIEHTAIHWEGFGDESRVPKNSRSIHIILYVV